MIDPDSSTPLFILLVLLALHAFFAAAKESIASVRKGRRVQLMEDGKPAAQKIDWLAEDPSLLLATEQLALKFLGFAVVGIAVAVYTIGLAQAISVSNFAAALIIALVTALIVLFLGELLPKEIARTFAEPIAAWTIRPFCWLSYLAAPLARFVTAIARILTGRSHEPEGPTIITEEDLLSYVDVGEEEGVLKEDEKEMIYSIFDLDDTMIREVMVPRIDICAVEVNTSIEEAIDLVIEEGHSRVPVFVDTIDNIVGVLYVKDLLVYWGQENVPSTIKGIEREVYYVPETKPASELLRELQARKVHIAIVVDEYGGTAGLVTIEDIIEEIVGEIQDEHDADEFFMQYISDNEYIFSARMDLDDINDMMSLELPTDESDTLGGLVYNLFGRIPKKGDSLSGESFGASNLHFTVLEVEGRRMKSVKIKRLTKEGGEIRDDGRAVKDQSSSTLLNNASGTLSKSS